MPTRSSRRVQRLAIFKYEVPFLSIKRLGFGPRGEASRFELLSQVPPGSSPRELRVAVGVGGGGDVKGVFSETFRSRPRGVWWQDSPKTKMADVLTFNPTRGHLCINYGWVEDVFDDLQFFDESSKPYCFYSLVRNVDSYGWFKFVRSMDKPTAELHGES